jgi:serine/threonine protein kinase
VTEKEKLGSLFQYCPEMILTKNKSNSIKSDVWSIGIILLDMLFDLETTKLNTFEFHPYNRSDTDLSEDDFIILDNIKQLYSKSFSSKKTEDLGFRSDDISIRYDSLSQDCKDLIKKCLEMNK